MNIKPIARTTPVAKIKSTDSVSAESIGVAFINTINNIMNVDNVKIKKPINHIYPKQYEVDISPNGMEYLKIYENDDYPIVNSHIFSYTKDLKLIAKI